MTKYCFKISFFLQSEFFEICLSCLQKNIEELEGILGNTNCKKTKLVQIWKIEIDLYTPSLRSLSTQRSKISEDTFQSFEFNPMELMAVNLIKTDDTSTASKCIGLMPDEDVLEVFI